LVATRPYLKKESMQDWLPAAGSPEAGAHLGAIQRSAFSHSAFSHSAFSAQRSTFSAQHSALSIQPLAAAFQWQSGGCLSCKIYYRYLNLVQQLNP